MALDVALAAHVRGALIDVADNDKPTDRPEPTTQEPTPAANPETPATNPAAAGQPTAGSKPETEHGIGRREFLNTTWKVLGAALVVEAVWTSYDILKPEKSAASGGVLNAGSASDYPEGTVKYFLDGRFYVTSSDGNLVALYQKCPHLGCKVPFCDSSGQFECPCHGSRYNIRGEYIAGPAPHGMDRFPIKVDGGQVFVDTTAPVQGPPRGIATVSNVPKGPSCVTVEGSSGSPGGATPAAGATS
jgi:cytochrome b6-f complex iron-sulfur subunit